MDPSANLQYTNYIINTTDYTQRDFLITQGW